MDDVVQGHLIRTPISYLPLHPVQNMGLKCSGPFSKKLVPGSVMIEPPIIEHVPITKHFSIISSFFNQIE
jgi:hypothetical protein